MRHLTRKGHVNVILEGDRYGKEKKGKKGTPKSPSCGKAKNAPTRRGEK